MYLMKLLITSIYIYIYIYTYISNKLYSKYSSARNSWKIAYRGVTRSLQWQLLYHKCIQILNPSHHVQHIPSNCPGNIPVTLNSPVLSSKIFLARWEVSDSRPGPNIAIRGTSFLGHNVLSLLERLWKLLFVCFIRLFTSGEHFK